MSNNFRHHVAHPAVIFVLPEAGSPKSARTVKPNQYKHDQREAWRPRTKPPSEPEKLVRFLDNVHRNDQAARSMLKPAVAGLKAWLTTGTLGQPPTQGP